MTDSQTVSQSVSLFTDLDLTAPILRAITDEGYSTPTPIQAATIPPALAGRDILGCAQTGTGKTAAFVLPILQRLTAQAAPARGGRQSTPPIRALILSPTRELASQIAESVAAYGRHLRLSHTVIFGGVSQHGQVKALRRGVDIVVATPGRLLDLMEQRVVDLRDVSILVLDEADRMLDMGFIAPIRRIAAALPARRHTMLFSATMPKAIAELAESLLDNPVRVAVTPVASTVDLITQSLIMVGRDGKQSRLEKLVAQHDMQRVVVFTKTKHGADRVTRRLTQAGISATAIHGNKAQNQRERALAAFRAGRARILVATDVAARGLDVDGISHVINFDLPMEPEAYVHRIGRTGRAGAAGAAISFCDPCPSSGETDLLRQIHQLLKTSIPSHDGTPTPIYDANQRATGQPARGSNGARGRGGKPRSDRQGGPRGGRPESRNARSAAPRKDDRRDGSAARDAAAPRASAPALANGRSWSRGTSRSRLAGR